MVWRNFRRRGMKFLRLTPSGFAMEEGWRSTSGDWSEVEYVTDEVPGQQAPTSECFVWITP
jgi:hypothetical protein